MPTILILDNDIAETDLIRRVAREGNYTVLVSQTLDQFQFEMLHHPVDLAVISLATVPERDTTLLRQILSQADDMKVLAIAPGRPEDGLATLLRAESLQAHRLLVKPIDPHQLLNVLNLTFPQPTGQD